MTLTQAFTAEQIQVVDTPEGAEVSMPCIHSVGIDNLCEVISHDINRLLGSTSHVVRLVNGGFLNLAYADSGALLVLEGHAIRVSITPKGQLIVGAHSINDA
jgi:hypothetical protein